MRESKLRHVLRWFAATSRLSWRPRIRVLGDMVGGSLERAQGMGGEVVVVVVDVGFEVIVELLLRCALRVACWWMKGRNSRGRFGDDWSVRLRWRRRHCECTVLESFGLGGCLGRCERTVCVEGIVV